VPSYTNTDDLYNYVGALFDQAWADPELGPKFAKTGAVLLVKCTEPDSEVVLDMPNQKAYPSVAESPNAPNATLKMSTETANAFWQGKVNMTLAMAKGQVKAEGSVMKVLKLVPNVKHLFPVYVERLRAEGHDELVV
jgi:putative sterol carrier protein